MKQENLKILAHKCSIGIETGKFYNEPYKHLIVDNFFPEDLAAKCLSSFPKINDGSWEHQNDKNIEIKSRSNWKSEFDIPENIIDAVRILNSTLILQSFSQVFGIKKLLPDPYFSGGGLNITQRGMFLLLKFLCF